MIIGVGSTDMKKLKIAVDARTLGSRPSGVGMYLNDFLEQLIKYDEFEWVLFTDVKESEYIKRFEARGISVIAWGKPVYKSVGVYAYFAFIKKALKQVKPRRRLSGLMIHICMKDHQKSSLKMYTQMYMNL